MPAVGLSHFVEAVLFDLDGTLVDSAPDLAGAANDLRGQHGLQPLPFEVLRPMVGAGARGMVGVALGQRPGDASFEDLRDRFLELYAGRMLQETRVFDDVEPVLQALERSGVPWGIVTNKATRFTQPLVEALGLGRRAAALVAGDTTPFSKPHPEPLLEAARRLGVEPSRCVYVGDDRRDVQAGRGAGMATAVACWGYLGEGEGVECWGADRLLESPHSLLKWLAMA